MEDCMIEERRDCDFFGDWDPLNYCDDPYPGYSVEEISLFKTDPEREAL